MISLCFLLIGVILFVAARNLCLSVMIYYGHVEPRGEPNYPLSWFVLKTKLKKLMQMGVLKYLKYQSYFTET